MSVDDVATLKAMFAGNDENLKVLRKVFFPELEAENPIGINFDLWSKLDLSGLSPEAKVIRVEAHALLVQHVETCLQMIKTLAGWEQETPEQTMKRLTKASAK